MNQEFSFWGCVDFPDNISAREQRDRKARELKSLGHTIQKSVIRNQLRKYAGLGIPDGRIGNVYYVRVLD